MYLSTFATNPTELHIDVLSSVYVILFLFDNRGFKLVGPFIVMIYNMIAGDLLRFLIIYLIFLLGFSQGNDAGLNLYIHVEKNNYSTVTLNYSIKMFH